jgi:hypothetical protein
MTRNRTHAFLLAAALALGGGVLAGSAPIAGAQGTPSSVPGTQRIIKVRFQVLHMWPQSIQVRSLVDMRELHTFVYSPGIRDKMQNILNAGGYQYGDKVVVWYRRGADVALKIKGKPSKPN